MNYNLLECNFNNNLIIIYGRYNNNSSVNAWSAPNDFEVTLPISYKTQYRVIACGVSKYGNVGTSNDSLSKIKLRIYNASQWSMTIYCIDYVCIGY